MAARTASIDKNVEITPLSTYLLLKRLRSISLTNVSST